MSQSSTTPAQLSLLWRRPLRTPFSAVVLRPFAGDGHLEAFDQFVLDFPTLANSLVEVLTERFFGSKGFFELRQSFVEAQDGTVWIVEESFVCAQRRERQGNGPRRNEFIEECWP